MAKIAVILSGCGFMDGAEICESLMTLFALEKKNIDFQCFAPDKPQAHVINHLNGEEMNEQRNVLIESSRIARGEIKELGELKPSDFDALVMPGGFGVAKNLSTFAFDGPKMSVDPLVEKVVKEFHQQSKPIGALCISPVVLSKLFGDVELTIGQNADVASALKEMGSTHHNKSHGEIVVDSKNKLVTTPCYMLDSTIPQIAEGAENAVNAVLEMIS